jgi:hypothetical protein
MRNITATLRAKDFFVVRAALGHWLRELRELEPVVRWKVGDNTGPIFKPLP